MLEVDERKKATCGHETNLNGYIVKNMMFYGT